MFDLKKYRIIVFDQRGCGKSHPLGQWQKNTTKDILDFIAGERDNLSEADRAQMTVCLKADEETKMGVVADVKQELRRANALKLSYASSKVLSY